MHTNDETLHNSLKHTTGKKLFRLKVYDNFEKLQSLPCIGIETTKPFGSKVTLRASASVRVGVKSATSYLRD